MFFYFFLAGFGVWKVLSVGMEWWRNHSSDCRSHVSPPGHEDGCMGGQCLCLWTGPSALWWWLSSDGVVIFSAWCRGAWYVTTGFCWHEKRSATSPTGALGWGSPWKRCTERKPLLRCGWPGWMAFHSLRKDQKVLRSRCSRFMTQTRSFNLFCFFLSFSYFNRKHSDQERETTGLHNLCFLLTSDTSWNTVI